MAQTTVYLVGAGPGSADLITLRGLRALQHADVILHDALLDASLLEHARPDAERIDVGKRPHTGRHEAQQAAINRLLIEKARQGGVVCRLKGGDAYLFGRGGEEAEALAQAGIDYEVIPGVTAAIAAGALADMPLTHRDRSSAVVLLTGHRSARDEDPDDPYFRQNWAALANAGSLVFYMGVRSLPTIVQRLREAGLPPATPVAIVERVSWPTQRTTRGSLADIVAIAEREGVASPAVVIVGSVTTLPDRLRPPLGSARRPLDGQSVLVTRPRHAAASLREALAEAGATVLVAPMIRTQAVADDSAIRASIDHLKADAYRWLVLTSPTGVAHAFDRLWALGADSRALGRTRIAVVGEATAAALRQRGLRPDCVASQSHAASLADDLLTLTEPGDRLLLWRADRGTRDLPTKLREADRVVDDVAVYETVPMDTLPQGVAGAIAERRLDWLTFASGSAVEQLWALLDEGSRAALQGTKIATIGPRTSDVCRSLGLAVTAEAAEPSPTAMVAAMAAAVERDDG